jgi:GDPmannose 4,6-dehydratase
MQHKRPDDYVVATGETYSVRDFITLVSNLIGMKLTFVGSEAKEYCVDKISNKKVVMVDKKYFRDNELYRLKGNPKKIKKILNWKPQYNFQHLAEDMVRREIDSLRLKSKFVF